MMKFYVFNSLLLQTAFLLCHTFRLRNIRNRILRWLIVLLALLPFLALLLLLPRPLHLQPNPADEINNILHHPHSPDHRNAQKEPKRPADISQKRIPIIARILLHHRHEFRRVINHQVAHVWYFAVYSIDHEELVRSGVAGAAAGVEMIVKPGIKQLECLGRN